MKLDRARRALLLAVTCLVSGVLETPLQSQTLDNTSVVFLSNRDHNRRGFDLFLLSLQGTKPLNLTRDMADAGIIGMTSLLLESDLSPEQREYVETIRISGDTLLTLINDILDFSKIESVKLAFENINFNLRDIIEEALELMSERAHSKGVEMLCHVPPELPVALKGDPVRLRQVFINLIGNAVKFTEKGEIVINVTPLEFKEDDVKYSFAIKDTGIGIGEEQKALIFDPFVQADNSTRRKYGGTGLGLAIVKQLVELMGGTISIDSAPGKGTLFTFTACFKRQPLKNKTVFDRHQLLEALNVLIRRRGRGARVPAGQPVPRRPPGPGSYPAPEACSARDLPR